VKTLLNSCVKLCEVIELHFGVMSGVGLSIGVLDGVPIVQGEREGLGGFVHWFEWRI